MSSKKSRNRMTACGLTKQEVAAFLGIKVEDVKSNGPIPALSDNEKRARAQAFYRKYAKKD